MALIILRDVCSVGTRTTDKWDDVNKEVVVEVQAFDCTGFVTFNRPISEVVDDFCVGTTRRQIFHDGAGGVTNVDQGNSAVCGFVPLVDNIEVTERKRVKIFKDCRPNQVLLRWKNLHGGYGTWLFQQEQRDGFKVKSQGSIKPFEPEIENLNRTEQSTGKEASNELKVGADGLTTGEHKALSLMATAIEVLMYRPETNDFIGVNIKDGNFERNTADVFHRIELTVVLPELQTVKL